MRNGHRDRIHGHHRLGSAGLAAIRRRDGWVGRVVFRGFPVVALLAMCLASVWAMPQDTSAARVAGLSTSASGESAVALPDGTTNTQFGPLTPADRDFLVRVRWAGLWEGPSGQQAQQRAGSPAVKEAGRHMIAGHAELDRRVLAIGRQLGVDLPNEPNAQQKGWMAEMTAAKTPQEYDRIFVRRLRAAHGKVYALVAQIRAGTRNSLIRQFSEQVLSTVLDHIQALERTNLVNYSEFPEPALPPGSISGGTTVTQTKFGPLTSADREFLVRVRLAGLWEGPSGRQAQAKGGTDAVKEAGQHMIAGHAQLDQRVLELGRTLGVPLPTEPNADQRAWRQEMLATRTSQAFDQVFVDRLRPAHGKVFAFVAQIRSNTQNSAIRDFAEQAMTTVQDHMDMLERTGLVQFSKLPLPPPPVALAVSKYGVLGRLSNMWGVSLVAAMVVVAGFISVVAIRQLNRVR